LSPAVRAFLNEVRFGSAATVARSGWPQQSAMWYELQGDEIMMNTKVGRAKERNLKRAPRCSLCVVDGYSYVTVSGRARLDYHPATAQADIAHLAVRYHGEERARGAIENFRREQRVTIRFRIEHVVSHGL